MDAIAFETRGAAPQLCGARLGRAGVGLGPAHQYVSDLYDGRSRPSHGKPDVTQAELFLSPVRDGPMVAQHFRGQRENDQVVPIGTTESRVVCRP